MKPHVVWVLIFAALAATSTQPQAEASNTDLPTPTIDGQDKEENTRIPTPVFEDKADSTELTTTTDDQTVRRETEEEKKRLVKPTRSFLETNSKRVKGRRLHEGDMLLTARQWRGIKERKATSNLFRRWPKDPITGFVTVPFLFGDTEVDKTAVFDAVNHWESHTCVRFSLTDNANQPHLRFIKGNGCYSYVGLVFQTGQEVSIGAGCNSLCIVVHEIGHSLGFYHEQSRADRDDHVHINTDNIREAYRSNFRVVSEIGKYNVMYDLSSIMHYRTKAFTANGGSTIATKNLAHQSVLGQRDALSHRDILLVNEIYGCSNTWLDKCKLSSEPCQNEGFTGMDCECVCRPGTSGRNCSTVTNDYYDDIMQPYTEVTTNGTVITSPNYPDRYSSDLKRVTNILAPEGFHPIVTFSSFRLYGRGPYCDDKNCCYFDSLEIRTEAPYSKGDVFCGREIVAGQSFAAPGRQMVLYFETQTNYHTGWSANVTFMPDVSMESSSNVMSSPPTTTPAATTPSTDMNTSTKVAVTTSPTAGTAKQTVTTSSGGIISSSVPPTTTVTVTSAITTATATSSGVTAISTSNSSPATVEAPVPQCLVHSLTGRYYWTSPSYPEPYPNNFHCGLKVISNGNDNIVVKLLDFDLQPKKFGSCIDKLTITGLYGRETEVCNRPKWNQRVFVSPSYFYMTFSTDDSIAGRGFNISIEAEASSCHKIIHGVADSRGVIEIPDLSYHWRKEVHCEYRVLAPQGYQVRVDEVYVNIRSSRGCWKEYLLVNLRGERNYPATSSSIYCGRQYDRPVESVTTEGLLSLAYKGKNKVNKSSRVTYSIIANTS